MNYEDAVYLTSFQDYIFSGNIPTAIIDSDVDVEIQIKLIVPVKGTVIDITELHTPDWSFFGSKGIIALDLSRLITGHLYGVFPESPYGETPYFEVSDNYIQNNSVGTVEVIVAGALLNTFMVIKGTVDINLPVTHFNFENYLRNNILSLCPQIRYVNPDLINVLNIYSFGISTVYATAKILTGQDQSGDLFTHETVSWVATASADRLVTFDATFNTIVLTRFNAQWQLNKGLNIVHIDLHCQGNTGVNTSPIRLVPDRNKYQHDDLFCFENSLGGIDIIRFTGVLSRNIEHDYLSLANQNNILEYDTLPHTKHEKNTGFLLTQQQVAFANDFLASSTRYHYVNGEFKRIYLSGKDAKYKKGDLSSYSFTFEYAKANIGSLLDRKTTL